MKVKDMSMVELKAGLKKIQDKCNVEYIWVHENKRWKALLNEYERRVLKVK